MPAMAARRDSRNSPSAASWSSSPPASRTRSVSPISPVPLPGAAAPAPAAGSGLRMSISSRLAGPPVERPPGPAARRRACGRWSAPPGPPGRRCARPRRAARAGVGNRSSQLDRACPASRDSSTSRGRSASTGCGPARSVVARRSSRSTPITSRSSSSAWCAPARTTPRRAATAAPAARPAGTPARPRRWPAATAGGRARRASPGRSGSARPPGLGDPPALLRLGAAGPLPQRDQQRAAGLASAPQPTRAASTAADQDEPPDEGSPPMGRHRP